MKRFMMTGILSFMFASPIFAQVAPPIKVAVGWDVTDPATNAVASSLIPMISSDPRFALVSASNPNWDVEIQVTCILPTVNGQRVGTDCAYTYLWEPNGWCGISAPSGPAVIAGPDSEIVAKEIFTDALTEITPVSQEQALSRIKNIFAAIVQGVMKYLKTHPSGPTA